jgi:hypothetical protein
LSASASAASHIRLTVSNPMVGLNGGGSDMQAGYPGGQLLHLSKIWVPEPGR